MPEDPLAALMSQVASQMTVLNQNFLSMGENMLRGLNSGVDGLMAFAPHTVLANLTKGSGYFNAKTPTETLQRQNIF
jgi:hypothetical protein